MKHFSENGQIADTSAIDHTKQTGVAAVLILLADLCIHIHHFLSVTVKVSTVRMVRRITDDHPFVRSVVTVQINIIGQLCVDRSVSAVYLIRKPGKFGSISDQVGTIFIHLGDFPADTIPCLFYRSRLYFIRKQRK